MKKTVKCLLHFEVFKSGRIWSIQKGSDRQIPSNSSLQRLLVMIMFSICTSCYFAQPKFDLKSKPQHSCQARNMQWRIAAQSQSHVPVLQRRIPCRSFYGILCDRTRVFAPNFSIQSQPKRMPPIVFPSLLPDFQSDTSEIRSEVHVAAQQLEWSYTRLPVYNFVQLQILLLVIAPQQI